MTDDARRRNVALELDKATAALRAARALVDLGLGDDAVSRAYYAAYHAATAALYATGVEARTHAGTHDRFFAHFVREGPLDRRLAKDLAALQRFREQADDSSEVSFDAEGAGEEVERAGRVVRAVCDLLVERGVIPGGTP